MRIAASLQPGEGRWSGEATEALISAVNAARTEGLAPWLTLLQGAIPPWFDDEGGFAEIVTWPEGRQQLLVPVGGDPHDSDLAVQQDVKAIATSALSDDELSSLYVFAS